MINFLEAIYSISKSSNHSDKELYLSYKKMYKQKIMQKIHKKLFGKLFTNIANNLNINTDIPTATIFLKNKIIDNTHSFF